ncbi:flagellar motor protein MotB [Pseudomonas sp. TNT11]|uniref:Flagellar motor protein MotB n=1 Tax=Pseudomonas emilianonis TaxID=2915812 RepID=A0ABT0EK33_9PSED|nr:MULTISPECIES: flagellar motor protein MotB [Pseudomonas]MCK1785844.1 flagellar motor protein MotB [Pseudomonas emilianonis]WET09764.1 flagellar motor protein MotB [Pseudomonas sp. D3]
MSDRPIIIRRKKAARHAHHGGAWKIAFADFMTALMALFLVLWVLSNANKNDKDAIAEYFSTPLLVAMSKGDRSTSSTSAIPGGGPDQRFSEGERARQTTRPSRLSGDERRHLEALKQRLDSAVDHDPQLRELKQQIAIELSPEGLRVQLLDTDKRPMFELGSANVAPYLSKLLKTFAPVLNELPNRIQISGHTDSHPYPGGDAGYNNWDLSADRAKASRQELVSGGLDSNKLLRVSGMADRIRFHGAGPYDAANRRIEITVLDNRVAERILSQDEYGPAEPSAH